MKTHFAPPQRASKAAVAKTAEIVGKSIPIAWLDAIPMGVLILNEHRQIVSCNNAFKILSDRNRQEITGLRPGEALQCIHARLMEGGCGTSSFCGVCGAARAIVKSLETGIADCQHCRIRRVIEDAEVPLDLQVFSHPTTIDGEQLVMLSVMDISHELRLRYLERTFFHGLVNTAGGISSLTSILEQHEQDNVITPLLADCSKRILRDVLYHQDLAAAEQGRLGVNMQDIATKPFFTKLIEEECAIRNLQPSLVNFTCTCQSFKSDKRLLAHSFRQLLENALEASESCGSLITVSCVNDARGGVVLTMRNHGEMPEAIKKQIFKRYISSKDDDRGLGTYVIKTFVTNYLGGEVSFSSDKEVTTFVVHLPGPQPAE